MYWIVSPTTKFICWCPNPRCHDIWSWGLWKVMRFRRGHRWGPHDGTSAFVGRDARELAFPHSQHVRAQQEGSNLQFRDCPHQNLIMLAPRPQTSSLQNCQKIDFYWLSHPVAGVWYGSLSLQHHPSGKIPFPDGFNCLLFPRPYLIELLRKSWNFPMNGDRIYSVHFSTVWWYSSPHSQRCTLASMCVISNLIKLPKCGS